MAAVWRTLRSVAHLTLFSPVSWRISTFNTLFTTNRRATTITAAVSSYFQTKQRNKPQCCSTSMKHVSALISRPISTSTQLNKYYVKPNYLKKCGRRDMKRRQMFKEHEIERSGLRMIKKSDILPSGVRQKAAEDLRKLPLNSSVTRIRNRCVLTDRGRGIVGRFRVSRMMFRHFAEKGLIAGVHKAQW